MGECKKEKNMKTIDWEQRRYEIVKEVLPSLSKKARKA